MIQGWIGAVRRWWRPPLGQRGERLAARHLRRQGYRILGRNLRNRFGEIDVLAEAPDRRTIVVVEVKSGAALSEDSPRPEVHVNAAKQRKLVALACQIARQGKLTERPIRFDVVAVQWMPDGQVEIRHHPGAFEAGV